MAATIAVADSILLVYYFFLAYLYGSQYCYQFTQLYRVVIQKQLIVVWDRPRHTFKLDAVTYGSVGNGERVANSQRDAASGQPVRSN